MAALHQKAGAASAGTDQRRETGEESGSEDVLRPGSYVVGIGASADGLEAIERFFDHLPVDPGVTFVVVQHLSPDFKSLMNELLARHTELTIRQVEDGVRIEQVQVNLLHNAIKYTQRGGEIHYSLDSDDRWIRVGADLGADVGSAARRQCLGFQRGPRPGERICCATAVGRLAAGWRRVFHGGRLEDHQAVMDAGFDHHLVKPIRFSSLTEILKTLPLRSGSCFVPPQNEE